jgi:hypothetical protein
MGLALFLGALTACAEAPSDEQIEAGVRSATASAIGLSVQEDAIDVSSIERTPTRMSWQAETSQGSYRCSSDERGQLPECTPLDS